MSGELSTDLPQGSDSGFCDEFSFLVALVGSVYASAEEGRLSVRELGEAGDADPFGDADPGDPLSSCLSVRDGSSPRNP